MSRSRVIKTLQAFSLCSLVSADVVILRSSYPRRHTHRRDQGVQSRLSVRLFVCTLKGKRLELSTPNLVHVYSIAVARHALIHWSKGQWSRSHGYETHTVAQSLVTDHNRSIVYIVLHIHVLPASFAGVGLHVDMTAYVFYLPTP